MLFWQQPLISPFPCHKSATTCQSDPNNKLELDLCNYVKTEMIESTAAPQYRPLATQTGQSFWGHSVL